MKQAPAPAAAIIGVIIGAIIGAIGAPAAAAQAPEHAVIVHFSYGSTDLEPLFRLEARLEAVIAEAAAGEYDGNEIAADGSDGYLYMYGPDADRLFEVVKPILASVDFMRGAQVRKRYGPAGTAAPESTVTLGP